MLRIGLILATIAALIGLFVVLNGGKRRAAVEPPSGTRSVEIRVRQGQLESAEPVVRLTEGERVSLVVISDRADELHLHGYDLHVRLIPNEPAKLSFVANLTGRFTCELHQAHMEIAVLEIYPP